MLSTCFVKLKTLHGSIEIEIHPWGVVEILEKKKALLGNMCFGHGSDKPVFAFQGEMVASD